VPLFLARCPSPPCEPATNEVADDQKITIPLVARDLVQRLSAALAVPFTLTDARGAVLASSGEEPRGRIDPTALIALREGERIERAGRPASGASTSELDVTRPTEGGMLAAGPGIYIPLRVNGGIDGVLIVHGQPDSVRTIANTAAAAAGLALEFARGASISARQTFAPSLGIHQLLRGSPAQARRGAVVARVVGWDLAVPRIALVVRGRGRLGSDAFTMIQKFVDTVAPGTPFAQLDLTHWVLLPELSPDSERRPLPRQFAEDVRTGLLQAGVTATLGLGEAHAESSIPALRRSYREAMHAARWGYRLHRRAGVYVLRDLGPAAFLAPDSSSRRRLAERILQPLRGQPDVLLSLEAFLTSSCSVTATADATGQHRHTIRNHLDRVRALTGLDPRSLDDALQLRLALLLG
jgi:carbohydrate diacid regulator